ncbi:MAG: ATP-binding protein [bacterium]
MHFDLLPFIFASIASGSILIGIAALLNGERKISSVFFALTACSAGLWIGFTVLRFYLASNGGIVMEPVSIFTKFSSLFVVSIFYFFLLFTYSFTSSKLVMPKTFFMVITVAYVGLMILLFVPGAIYISEQFIIQNGVYRFQPRFELGSLYQYYYAPFIIVCFLISIARLVKAYKTAVDALEKIQVRDMLAGVGVSGGIGIAAWFVTPLFSSFGEFFWIGHFAVFFFVIAAAYAVLRHQLFKVKIVGTEFLMAMIWVFLLARLILVTSMDKLFTNSIIFCAVVVFGMLVIKNIRREGSRMEELEEVSAQLESMNKQLEELDVTKTRFLSFATHQVKTPMTAIKGYSSLIYVHLHELSREKVIEMINRMRIATDRTIHLVDSLLDVKKMQEGRMEYRFSAVNIVSMVKSAVEELQLIAKEKGLRLFMESENEHILIHADKEKFREVIQNLVENAVKYTEKGWVKVKVYREKDDVLVHVSDSGRGIEKDVIPLLFSEFSRGKGVSVIQGTGLGLYIAKQIVLDHHGEIWAESEGLGMGSSFYIRIPHVEKRFAEIDNVEIDMILKK